MWHLCVNVRKGNTKINDQHTNNFAAARHVPNGLEFMLENINNGNHKHTESVTAGFSLLFIGGGIPYVKLPKAFAYSTPCELINVSNSKFSKYKNEPLASPQDPRNLEIRRPE